MLILKSKPSQNALGTEVYLEVRESTGDYDAEENEGGFGSPNPERSTIALLVYAVHKLLAGNVTASVQAYNPASVATFTIAMSRAVNGIIDYTVFALTFYDDQITYEDGDVVYDIENPSEPFVKEMVLGEWVVRSLPEIIGNANVIQHSDTTISTPAVLSLKNQLLAEKVLKLRAYKKNEIPKEELDDARFRCLYVDGLHRSAMDAFCNQAFNEAQTNIEEILKYESEVLLNE